MSEFSSSESADELDQAGHGSLRRRLSSSASSTSTSSKNGTPKEKKKRGSIGSRMRGVWSYMMGRQSPSNATSSPHASRSRSDTGDEGSTGDDLNSGVVTMDLGPLPDPTLIGSSNFGELTFNTKLASALRLHLPEVMQIQAYKLVYSLYNNGSDLASFYKGGKGYDYTLLIVETLDGCVFGGFCSREWKPIGSYFGTGESFIFGCGAPGKGQKEGDAPYALSVYTWTHMNNYFCFADLEKIAMGGGGQGFGFVIDADFRSVGSSSCVTFGNDKSLDIANESGTPTSRIANVELWAFVPES